MKRNTIIFSFIFIVILLFIGYIAANRPVDLPDPYETECKTNKDCLRFITQGVYKCGTNSKKCVECNLDTDCSGGKLCKDNKCVGCTTKEDCGELLDCISNVCLECNYRSIDLLDVPNESCKNFYGEYQQYCSVLNKCINCAIKEDGTDTCPQKNRVCQNNECVGCDNSAFCSGGYYCYDNNGNSKPRCVECIKNNGIDTCLTSNGTLCGKNNKCFNPTEKSQCPDGYDFFEKNKICKYSTGPKNKLFYTTDNKLVVAEKQYVDDSDETYVYYIFEPDKGEFSDKIITKPTNLKEFNFLKDAIIINIRKTKDLDGRSAQLIIKYGGQVDKDIFEGNGREMFGNSHDLSKLLVKDTLEKNYFSKYINLKGSVPLSDLDIRRGVWSDNMIRSKRQDGSKGINRFYCLNGGSDNTVKLRSWNNCRLGCEEISNDDDMTCV